MTDATDPQSPPTSTTSRSGAASARARRQRTLSDARRALVLDAARAVFFERGLEGTSMREIAQRAGYTAGALYSYFSSKEAIYGALLGESLQRLNARVHAAEPGSAPDPAHRLHASALAFFAFYREHPRDLDLGFYLFQGAQPRGLTPTLNAELNRQLREALQPVQQALEALGMEVETASAEVTSLFAHAVGVLILSHTGRIRMFRQSSQALFERYLAQLLARASAVQAPARSAPMSPAATSTTVGTKVSTKPSARLPGSLT